IEFVYQGNSSSSSNVGNLLPIDFSLLLALYLGSMFCIDRLDSVKCMLFTVIHVHDYVHVVDEVGHMVALMKLSDLKIEVFKMVCEAHGSDVDIGIPVGMLSQEAGANKVFSLFDERCSLFILVSGLARLSAKIMCLKMAITRTP
ncbi:hypothetical protein Tco_1065011, partial [Tanacetum coccineum]